MCSWERWKYLPFDDESECSLYLLGRKGGLAMIAAEKLMNEIKALPENEYTEVVKFVNFLKLKHSIPETMLLTEVSLAKYWDTPEEDEAWADL